MLFRLKRVYWILLSALVTACGAGNEPTASFQITNDTASNSGLVELDASASSDPDGEIAEYRWQLSDGTQGEGAQFSHQFKQAGSFEITLTVVDEEGSSASTTQSFTFQGGNTFSLSGEIRAFSHTNVDGDTNDPNAPVTPNNGDSDSDVQTISNPVFLNGYQTYLPTGESGDAFVSTSDLVDAYRVTLNEGDYVSLRVINFYAADLDLQLFEADTMDMVAFSNSPHEFESVQAPASGEYIVWVSCLAGESKYWLKVGESSLADAVQAQGQSANFKPHEFIVKAKGDRALSHIERAQLDMSHRQLMKRPGLAKLNPINPQTRAELTMAPQSQKNIIQQRNPVAAAKLDTIVAMKAMRKQDDIEYAELNFSVEPMFTPNDPLLPNQWYHNAINSRAAWDITLGDSNVLVAVIDSGIFSGHPDLAGQIVQGYDFISYESAANDGDGVDPDPEDAGGVSPVTQAGYHGTHVAGIVAAVADNGVGVAGVAPEVKVMPVRAIGLNGGYTYDVHQAVRYAAGLDNDSGTVPARAADIINLSLGGGGYSFSGEELYQEVRDQGVFVVAASGNQNSGIPLFPGAYSSVISVAATNLLGERADYSNYGPFVDVAAPGGDILRDLDDDGWTDGILSTSVQERDSEQRPGYQFYQGTSMAAPIMSGVIALMKSVSPQMTPDEFDALLALGELTLDAGSPGRDDLYGFGLIDAEKAVLAAQKLADGEQFTAVLPSKYRLNFDLTRTSDSILLSKIGTQAVAVSSIDTDADWLTVSPQDVDDEGLGAYQVEVDIGSLTNSALLEPVQFTLTNGQIITVYVNVRLDDINDLGDAGYIYVQLFDANTDRKVTEAGVTATDGVYQYQFDGLAEGDYYVLAGSDVDHDNFLCSEGEMCGYYPSQDFLGKIQLNQNLSGIDFWIGGYEPVVVTGASSLLLPLNLGMGIERTNP